MKAAIQIGRFWGVSVGLHWSVLVIVALLMSGIGFGQLPVVAAGYAWWVYLVAGFVTALFVLASLLAHELAHALVARRTGQEVEGITLWMLGGLASLKGQARTPGAEFRVAAVGPATSLLVALVSGAALLLASMLDADPLVLGVLAYLAFINVVLGAFNLVPAAPLDGGRILRSALWAWWDDPHRATVWSTRIGRGFGFVLIALGVWSLFTGLVDGLWWSLIGLFIVTMASEEERQSTIGRMLEGLRVRDVMTPDPETVDGGLSVSSFLQDVALARRHSAFPLVDEDGVLQGMVTLARLKRVALGQRGSVALREVACEPKEIPLVQPDDPLADLLTRMNGCTDGRALVFEAERLVGIVSPTDISRAVSLQGLNTGRS
ncbi:site-2 protease family protein, partial [Lentzea albidocapillata]|uniref:Zinc metalloprotease n=1 Tax=Lentzea albidocapillata TaxID=40571 RepID=A0A1W2FRX2_9PSEU